MAGDTTDREQGVDFSDFNSVLEEISFPITVDELVAQYGEHSIERTNAEPITVRELFEQAGDDTLDSPEAVRQSMLNFMPRDSVGREEYSDRGGSLPEATEAADRLEEDESL